MKNLKPEAVLNVLELASSRNASAVADMIGTDWAAVQIVAPVGHVWACDLLKTLCFPLANYASSKALLADISERLADGTVAAHTVRHLLAPDTLDAVMEEMLEHATGAQ